MKFREWNSHPLHRCTTDQDPVALNPALLGLLKADRVLLLQGPVGPFYDRLTKWLLDRDKQVDRIVFQGGDQADCRLLTPRPYRGTPADWPDFFRQATRELGTECIVLFGQSRYYHRVALELALEAGIKVVVLEEGYLRPGFITMELEGVNGYSQTLTRYRWADTPQQARISLPTAPPKPWLFQQMCWFAARHYWAMKQSRAEFPHYRHHKTESLAYYAAYWIRSWARKLWHNRFEHLRVKALASQAYFFVPLQYDGDAQITHHSPYHDNTDFILRVLRSFAKHAPQDCKLVFKTHPFSRGGPGHSRLIFAMAKELGMRDRVLHLMEGHIPTLLNQARGVVVINSTVGLQALGHGKPLAMGGDALYKLKGLVHSGRLDNFWTDFKSPDPVKLKDFMEQLRHLTQAPCHVYGLRNEPLHWTVPALRQVK